MKRGIILVATGHTNYPKMAFNLALSLKQCDKAILIHLVHTKGNLTGLTELQKIYFDSFTELESNFYTIDNKEQHVYTKTRVFEFSPFEETIFLDVDSIWLPKQDINSLFEKFKNKDFGFTCYSENDVFPITSERSVFWNAEGECINDLNKYFKFKKDAIFYHIQSSFLYFKKTDKAKAIFDKAEERFRLKDFGTREWANGMGDEFAFSISLALNNVKEEKPYQPIFWYPAGAGQVNLVDRKKLYETYYFVSMAGNRLGTELKNFYNTLVLVYYQRSGKFMTNSRWSWIDKFNFLKERLKH